MCKEAEKKATEKMEEVHMKTVKMKITRCK